MVMARMKSPDYYVCDDCSIKLQSTPQSHRLSPSTIFLDLRLSQWMTIWPRRNDPVTNCRQCPDSIASDIALKRAVDELNT
jgi:hypothetical protein